jgi:Tol biopolymer transport system component
MPPPGQGPTPTPVAPLPGLVYSNKDGLWWVTAAPVLVTERGNARLSPDGLYAFYLDDDDIWLLELATGVERNLTGDNGRVHCCAQWWPARPGTIIFGSWPADADLGPSTGFLSVVDIDGSDYRVLDEENQSNGLPSPGPDGQTIAYDRGGTSWLFRWETGSERLDPIDYGLSNVVRIGGPSWSPDGEQLAWTVAITDPEWRIAVAVFDLASRTAYLLHPYENTGRGGWFSPPAWSPDGRWLAYLVEDINRDNRGVWVVSVDGSEEAFLGPGLNPIWSPDGRFLTFTGISETGAAGETVPWLVDPGSWYEIPLNLPPGSMVVDWLELSPLG